jgi:REP element-mobilizing transposase RayT
MPPATDRVYYHVTFQTRQRRPVLYAEVEACLLACLPEIARRGEFTVVEAGCALTHVHLLIEKAPWADLLHITRLLQIETSARVLQQFPDLALDLNSPNLWDTGYHYVRHSAKSVEVVKQYIRDQKRHHGLE